MTTITYKMPNGRTNSRNIPTELVKEFIIQLKQNNCVLIITK